MPTRSTSLLIRRISALTGGTQGARARADRDQPSDKSVHPRLPGSGLPLLGHTHRPQRGCPVAVFLPHSTPLSPLILDPYDTLHARLTVGLGTTSIKARKAPTKGGNRNSGRYRGGGRSRRVEITGSTNPVANRWRDLDDLGKLAVSARAAQNAGGYAFSLNLSIGREAGFAERENAMRGFQKRLSDGFKAQGLPSLPVAVQLEASRDDDRLHLHGVIIPGGYCRDALARALRQAGGLIRGRRGSRQCKLTPITDSDGWTGYILKDVSRTDRQTPGRLTYISNSMKRLAQQVHEGSRRGAWPANTDEGPTASTEISRDDIPVSMGVTPAGDEMDLLKRNPFYGMFG